jgi:hypothetical protein
MRLTVTYKLTIKSALAEAQLQIQRQNSEKQNAHVMQKHDVGIVR